MTTAAERIDATLAGLLAAGADAASVADAACVVWRNVDVALSPIIGRHAVAALYKRSLHVARSGHPVLFSVHDSAGTAPDFIPLGAALAGRSGADAAAANNAVVGAFYDLLCRLIGAALTERLLISVHDNPSTNRAEQTPRHDNR